MFIAGSTVARAAGPHKNSAISGGKKIDEEGTFTQVGCGGRARSHECLVVRMVGGRTSNSRYDCSAVADSVGTVRAGADHPRQSHAGADLNLPGRTARVPIKRYGHERYVQASVYHTHSAH